MIGRLQDLAYLLLDIFVGLATVGITVGGVWLTLYFARGEDNA